MTHDELGTRSIILGAFTRESLEAVPLMSEEVRKKSVSFLIREMERDGTPDRILEQVMQIDFEMAHKVMKSVMGEIERLSPGVRNKVYTSRVTTAWINRHENSLHRKIGVGTDCMGRSFAASRHHGSIWKVKYTEGGQDKVRFIEGCNSDEEAHDRWIAISSEELKQTGTQDTSPRRAP